MTTITIEPDEVAVLANRLATRLSESGLLPQRTAGNQLFSDEVVEALADELHTDIVSRTTNSQGNEERSEHPVSPATKIVAVGCEHLEGLAHEMATRRMLPRNILSHDGRGAEIHVLCLICGAPYGSLYEVPQVAL